jgi:hypothetical protein
MEHPQLDLIPGDAQSNIQPTMTEGELLVLLSERVQWYLDHDKDLLLSYLYRLDISEKQIDEVLMPGHPDTAAMAMAKLILHRQKERVESKKKYKVDPIEGWEF